ncbi:MAG: DUF262 domain-containing protein [Akkermansia sp.]|nr:DUF262 domain-containing protein [Akkermansia sp.]
MPKMEEREQQPQMELDFEKEDEGIVEAQNSYDASKIRVEQRSVNLGTLLGMLRENQIIFDTEYQREAGLWKKVEKSRLIESVLLGLPLPSFFFSERSESDYEWEVIDGLQRLCTFQEFFIDKTLKLSGLEFMKQYEGATYNDFTSRDKWRMEMLILNLNVVTRQTPNIVKYILFNRVNSAGYVLTEQEMRHALLHGIPAQTVKELAECTEFTQATAPTKFKRMADRELVARYLAFRLLTYKGDRELNEFIFAGMEILKTIPSEQLDAEKKLFKQVLKTAHIIFRGRAFRKPSFPPRLNPISKALFDAVTIELAVLTQEQREILEERAEDFIKAFENEYQNSNTFEQDLTTGTARKATVLRRWETMKTIINSVL